MQPVQINPQGTNAAEPHRPMLHPLHGQNVDLANESGLGVGDLARAARNLWSLCKRSLPWLMGAFGVYQIWRLFEDRADHAPAKSPEEAAVVPAGGRPARRPPSPSPAISGPIAGLRAAALGVVGAAVAAIEDPEKRKPSDPFALRLLRTVTRFAGPGANTGLALEEAAPDVICGTRLLSRGDAVHAGGAFARAFVKTAMTMAAGRAGETAGEWALGWLPAGRPVGRWLGWVLGSAFGERLGTAALAGLQKIAASLKQEPSASPSLPEELPTKTSVGARRKAAASPEIRPEEKRAAAGPRPDFVTRTMDRGIGR